MGRIKCERNRQTSRKYETACAQTCAHKQQERFVASFCLHVYPPPPSLHPSPNRFSYPLSLSSLCFALSHTSPLPSLAHLSSIHRCLGAIAANQTVYPSLISALPHGGSCPLKTMRVGPSAEPGIRFNYINKKKKEKKDKL